VEISAGTNNIKLDLNADERVDNGDLTIWVKTLKRTWFGDATLDGEFNSIDLVQVFREGQYEDDMVHNSTWSTGDWNADREFTTSDLVVAFQDGGYERGPRAVEFVPEPRGASLLLLGATLLAKPRTPPGRTGIGTATPNLTRAT
jgi:hypothetical protein